MPAGPVGVSPRTVFNASRTSRCAPRAEFADPFRSRCATITGAACWELTVAISAFRPRTWL